MDMGGDHAFEDGDRGATGTVTLGRDRSFDFRAAPAEGDAGLYRREGTVEGETVVVGWVVLPDGSFRGSATVRSTAQDCQNLKSQLNRLLVKRVVSGTESLADLDSRVNIHRALDDLGC